MKAIFKYPRNLWIIAVAAMIRSAGSSFLWPLHTIYISEHLGRSVTMAGFVLMIQAFGEIIGSFIGGYVYDKVGGKKSILICGIITCICLFQLALFTDWYLYITVMIILGLTGGFITPVLYASIGGTWPEERRKAFNFVYVAQNLGMAVGASIGGIIAEFSFTLVFIINSLTYLLFILIIFFGLRDNNGERNVILYGDDKLKQSHKQGNYDRGNMVSLVVLCLGFMNCWFVYSQWSSIIPTYMNGLGFSISSYSLLWTVNGLLIIFTQPFISFVTKRFITTLRSQLLVGISILMLSAVVLIFSERYYGFVIAMAVLTFGEMFIWPAVPAAASEIAPEGRIGMFQGIANGFASTGRMMGPFIGGLLYDYFIPQVMLYTMILSFFLASVSFYYYNRIEGINVLKRYVNTSRKNEGI